ncbi:MAG: sulfite exporter TauE/SafE family protein [Myxococcota bacterium]
MKSHAMDPGFATPLVVAGASSALVAGVTGSLHCGLMCGPLACAPLPKAGGGRRQAAAAWHLGRVVAYGSVGALLGALGAGVARALTLSVQPWLPWVMAAGLVVTALDLGRFLKPLPGVGRVSRGLARWGATLPPSGRAFALGAATPFLPCGLLYGIFLAALATGSARGGAVVLLAFSVGAVPLLAGVQLGSQAWNRWPGAAAIVRRAVPLAAAILLIVRALWFQDTSAGCH